MRSIIFTSLLLATPAMGDAMGCFAAQGLQDRPVDGLSLYVFHNAARQGRYATIRAESAGTEGEILAACPTDTACVASDEGGSLLIEETEDGIEVITDRFAFDGIDLGNGTPVPVRYALLRAQSNQCGGPA